MNLSGKGEVIMLNENLKQLRKSKALTQEEFALKLNVVRQTISKWEKGLSVPDSEMLIEISEQFDVQVSTLLGETIEPTEKEDSIKMISDKLALLNEELAKSADKKRKLVRSFSFGGIGIVACYLFWQVATMIHSYSLAFPEKNASTSIVGGADGPISICVLPSSINSTSIVIIVAILLISISGIYLTRRK